MSVVHPQCVQDGQLAGLLHQQCVWQWSMCHVPHQAGVVRVKLVNHVPGPQYLRVSGRALAFITVGFQAVLNPSFGPVLTEIVKYVPLLRRISTVEIHPNLPRLAINHLTSINPS